MRDEDCYIGLHHAEVWLNSRDGSFELVNKSALDFKINTYSICEPNVLPSQCLTHLNVGKYQINLGTGLDLIIETWNPEDNGDLHTTRESRNKVRRHSAAKNTRCDQDITRLPFHFERYWCQKAKDEHTIIGRSGNSKVTHIVRRIGRNVEEVAQKVLIRQTKAWLSCIKAEKSILRRLDHVSPGTIHTDFEKESNEGQPSIVKIIDTFREDDPPPGAISINLEYCLMPSLGSYSNGSGQSTIPAAFLARILHTMPSVLAYLVEQEVEHNDIKPDNVLLDAGSFKLIDFGLASVGLPIDHYNGGTPAYLPPEFLYAPDAAPVLGRRDMFAFGVTLLFAMGIVTMPAEGWAIRRIKESSESEAKMMAWLGTIAKARERVPEGLECVKEMLEPRPRARITASRLMTEYELEDEELAVLALRS